MRTDSLSMKYSLIITWTYCIITPAVKGSVSKWPYVCESLKFHSTSLETALLNIRCSSQCSVCMCMCVYIWMVVLGCVLYLTCTNNWNNLPKKKNITSDNFFFPLLLLGYKDILCVNDTGTLVPFGQYSVVQMSTQGLLVLSSNSSACLCIVSLGTFCIVND